MAHLPPLFDPSVSRPSSASPGTIRVFIPADYRPQPRPHSVIVVNEQRLTVQRRHPLCLIPLDPMAAADRRKGLGNFKRNKQYSALDPSCRRFIRGRFVTCRPATANNQKEKHGN
jgi:hypothetical protein